MEREQFQQAVHTMLNSITKDHDLDYGDAIMVVISGLGVLLTNADGDVDQLVDLVGNDLRRVLHRLRESDEEGDGLLH